MEPDSAPETQHENKEDASPTSIWKRLLLPSLLFLMALSAGLSIYCAVILHKVRQSIDDVNFAQTVSDYNNYNDLVTPDLGTIQFMRRGYTISFSSITYGQNGLQLSGTLGNPTRLTISSLTLKLSARPYLYKVKDKVQKDPFFTYSGDFEIGSGQANVGLLLPGNTETFSMTIPNVKQTPDGFQIAASFTGERYSY
jgi:hypothetical protein